MSNKVRYNIPEELRELLLNFTLSYLLLKPTNMASFGTDYFQRLIAKGGHFGGAGGDGAGAELGEDTSGAVAEDGEASVGGGEGTSGGNEGDGAQSNSNNEVGGGSNLALPVEMVEASQTPSRNRVGSEDLTAPPPVVNQDGRRKSVFAEAYNPEEDGDGETPETYPKSDQQRANLSAAVKNILLFRSLDNDQIQEVIDCMFEVHVQAGENVINQGDDGDNFYVIES